LDYYKQRSGIRYKEYGKCDTLNNCKVIKVKDGDLRCIGGPKVGQVIYFTKKEEFQSYMQKNKVSRGDCSDKPEEMFNFNKYDVIIVSIGIGGCGLPENSFRVYEKNNLYVINLNFIVKEQICAMLNIFSRYFLLPKGKTAIPEFHIYETFNKCY